MTDCFRFVYRAAGFFLGVNSGPTQLQVSPDLTADQTKNIMLMSKKTDCDSSVTRNKKW